MPRQRLDQVDAMRPMKQAGVISTHVLTYFVPAASSVSTGAVMLLTHFSREGFFFISACMLTYAYLDLDRGGLRRFYGRRLVAVLVPYLCWSVIYFLYLLPTAHYANAPAALEKFAEGIATGYYQLYFLVIIMQYYLVFPLLIMFLRRTRGHHGAVVIIAALGHVALMTLLHWTIVPVLRTGWIEEFTPYAFYLITGSIAAFHLGAINEWLIRHVRLVIALTVAAALGAESVYFLADTGVTTALGSGNDPFQPSVIPFDIGAIACLYLLGVALVKPGRSRRLRAAVRIGSDNSYGVYLSQMLFINALIWVGWARLDSVVWWPLLCAATVVIVFLAGVALTSLLARTPLAIPLTGRPQQPWATWRPKAAASPAGDAAVKRACHNDVTAGNQEQSMGEFNDRPLDRAEERLERVARFLIGRPQPPRPVATHPFDARYGTDTSGWVNRRRLRCGHPNDTFISAYFGTPPSRFTNAIERWQATPDSPSPELCRFVDVGCGKGRVLLLASRMPFREAVSVELNPRLASIASANLARWRQQQEITTPASVRCADAVSSVKTLLDGPTLLYLCHPFGVPVLRELLRAMVAQQAALTAPVDLLYLFPVPEVGAMFSDFPQFQPIWQEEIPASPEDQDDGISTATDRCSLYRLRPAAVRSAAAGAPAGDGPGVQ